MKPVYHMVHYRRFETDAATKKIGHFERHCRNALDQKNSANIPLWERIADRFCKLESEEGRQVVLNRVADLSSAVFGEMCLIQDSGFQALLETVASKQKLSNLTVAEIYGLQEREAPKGSHFVRGLIYWLAVEDHLFFIRTQTATPGHLLKYFEQMLKSGQNCLPLEARIGFLSEFDPAEVKGDIDDIRSLRVSGKSAPQIALKPVDPAPKPRSTARTIADKMVEFRQALPVVEALFGPDRAQSLVASLGPKEYLSVDATVKVRGSRTDESRAKLRSIATELDDMTEGKVSVETPTGKISDGDAILRMRMPFTPVKDGSSLLDFDNVADQLQEVYARFVKDGKIA